MSSHQFERSDEYLQAFQQALDQNIIMSVTDNKGIIVYANKKFCEISKYTENELVGKSHNIINAGYHNSDFFKNLWGTILSGKMWQGEIQNRAKDGSFYWVDTVIVPACDESKKIKYFISLRTIITESKHAELALAAAIFKLSHKIRNPLVNMQALMTDCSSAGPLNNDQAILSGYMRNELNKMDQITRQTVLELYHYKKMMERASHQNVASVND